MTTPPRQSESLPAGPNWEPPAQRPSISASIAASSRRVNGIRCLVGTYVSATTM